MQTDTIRRCTNGTIDLDYYRARALSERAAVSTAFFNEAAKLVRPLIAVTVIVVTLFMMPKREITQEGKAVALLSVNTLSKGN